MYKDIKDPTFIIQLVYGIVIGGLSIAIIVQSLFAERELISPIQELIDAYQWVLSIPESVAESWLHPIVTRLNNRYRVALELQSIWLPLFILALMFVLDFVRRAWQDAMPKLATLQLVFAGSFILFGCILGSLFAPTGPSWAQGLIAALPFVMMVIGFVIAGLIDQIGRGRRAEIRSRLEEAPMGILGIFALFVVGFGSGAQLSTVLPVGAGLLALGMLIFSIALVFIFLGFRNNENQLRTGLTILFAYLGVGVIYVLDWGLR